MANYDPVNPNGKNQPPPYPTQPHPQQYQPQYGTQSGFDQQQNQSGFMFPPQGQDYPSQHQQNPPQQTQRRDPTPQEVLASVPFTNMDADPEAGRRGSDPTEGIDVAGFSDKAIRQGFIRKVYGILSVQLVITCGFIALFSLQEDIKMWTQSNYWIIWVAFALSFGVLIALSCCGDNMRRKFPGNLILLGIFTVCEGFMLGVVASYYDTESVLIAGGICAGVTLGLTIFAFQTKYDFTTCGGMLCGLLCVLCLAGFCMIFVPYNKYVEIVYGSIGALIFSMYIVFDTQLMLGGNHKLAIDPEEYIFAALNLYLDIINLFLYILRIVQGASSD